MNCALGRFLENVPLCYVYKVVPLNMEWFLVFFTLIYIYIYIYINWSHKVGYLFVEALAWLSTPVTDHVNRM